MNTEQDKLAGHFGKLTSHLVWGVLGVATLLMLAGIYDGLESKLPLWQVVLILALATFLSVMFFWLVREIFASEPEKEVAPIADAATPEEQQAALDHLAGLPHFCRLEDGSLFDYLHGSRVVPCKCGRLSAFHLLVRYGQGSRRGITLVSRGAVRQYLAVQDAIAAQLTSQPASTVEGVAT